MIHRDVKPANVLVPSRREHDGPRAKLTDFGVARVVGGDTLTRAGEVVGTAALHGARAGGRPRSGSGGRPVLAGARSVRGADGRQPASGFAPDDPRAAPRRPVPPLRRQRRDLPRELGVALDRALLPRPSERGGLEELRAALLAVAPRAGDTTGIIAPARTAPTRAATRDLGAATRSAARARNSGVRATTASARERRRAQSRRRPATRSERLPERALAAASAALAAGWLSAHLLAHAPLAPVAAGLLAGAATLVAPRLGLARDDLRARRPRRDGGPARWGTRPGHAGPRDRRDAHRRGTAAARSRRRPRRSGCSGSAPPGPPLPRRPARPRCAAPDSRRPACCGQPLPAP